MEQIKIVRLKTGIDIIGSVLEDGYQCIITNGMIIEVDDDIRNQRQILILSNWAPSSIIKQNICSIYENDILCKFDPTEEFVEHYIGTLRAMTEFDEAKKVADSMSDEEIMMLSQAMHEREQSTLQ